MPMHENELENEDDIGNFWYKRVTDLFNIILTSSPTTII